MTRTRLYRSGQLVAEGFPAEQIRGHLDEHDDAVVRLDLYDPDEADLGIVTEEFDLHPLAVDDAILDHQRPKLDRYPTHLFLNVHAVAVTGGDPTHDHAPPSTLGRSTRRDDSTPDRDLELIVTELSAFITPRALITVRKSAFDIDRVIARWDASGAPISGGVGFLVHDWLDAVVDAQYQTAQALEDVADDLEDALFDPSRRAEIRRRGFALRRALGRLRRMTAPILGEQGNELNVITANSRPGRPSSPSPPPSPASTDKRALPWLLAAVGLLDQFRADRGAGQWAVRLAAPSRLLVNAPPPLLVSRP